MWRWRLVPVGLDVAPYVRWVWRMVWESQGVEDV